MILGTPQGFHILNSTNSYMYSSYTTIFINSVYWLSKVLNMAVHIWLFNNNKEMFLVW